MNSVPIAVTPAARSDARVSILCVDDRHENRVAIDAILESLNVRIVGAGSGEEALKRLLDEDFAVILLDVQMPGMNGFETAELIKSREKTRHVPIIFLTAISTEPQYMQQGYAAGAVDYLSKPFHPEVLRAKVAVFVELHQKEMRLRESERRTLELQHRTTLLEQDARQHEELTALNEQLRERTRDLEQALTARNRFYASMSHELRTPINAIIGYNTLLLDRIYGELNDKQVHGLNRVQKAARHLLELVNDVLDLSKIEAGKIELSLQPVSFPALLEDLFVTVRPLADEHATSIELAPAADSSTIVTDPRRVRQILLNLLSNAIKFGDGKPIRVAWHKRPDDGVEVSVSDSGSGIATDDLQRIFDEFVQLSQGQPTGGTGLGLPISRRLATLLGGTLKAESQLGSGSTFTLCLPQTITEAAPPAALRAERISASFSVSSIEQAVLPAPVTLGDRKRNGARNSRGVTKAETEGQSPEGVTAKEPAKRA